MTAPRVPRSGGADQGAPQPGRVPTGANPQAPVGSQPPSDRSRLRLGWTWSLRWPGPSALAPLQVAVRARAPEGGEVSRTEATATPRGLPVLSCRRS